MCSMAASNPFECSKSGILAKFASGRYRTDMLCRHWGKNRSGFCQAPSCTTTPGTIEHILVTCPALSNTRERMYQMWLDKSVMFPSLHSTIRQVLASAPEIIVQFVLEPLAFPPILADFKSHGDQFSHQLAYLTRTFAFYMHNQYKLNLKLYNDQTKAVTNPNIVPGSDDREQILSDRVPATSCTSQLSCTVVPHTTTISTDQCRVVSVNCARNVASRTHSIRYRENLHSEPISNHPNARVSQTGCGSVNGGGGGAWADLRRDNSQHEAITTQTFH